MRTKLFTVLMEFEGTTSASQFHAASVRDALKMWLAGLGQSHCYGLTEAQRKRLGHGFGSGFDLDLEPAPLEGLCGVWFSSILPKSGGLQRF